MTLRNLNIAPRAALSFAVIALLVFILGGFALLQMSEMHKQSAEVDENWLPSIVALNQANQNFLRLRTVSIRLLLRRETALNEEDYKRAEELRGELSKAVSSFELTANSPEEKLLLGKFVRAKDLYLKGQDRVIELNRRSELAEAQVIVAGPMQVQGDEMASALDELIAFNDKGAEVAALRTNEAFETARNGIMVAIALAALATIALALQFTRSIVTPLNEAVKVAEVIAAGNLTQNIQVEGQDEPARLLAALKNMQQNLRTTILGISDSSNQLASASEELSAVTEDSTRGLHQQSNEIEQAATAVNEMTAAVDEVARNAVTTSEASRESDLIARHGREQVIKTVDAIGQLAQEVTTTAGDVEHLAGKVRDISKVLDVIRSIAEQTNLLALNAAIEAARAGDAGRGFAVVADEVRALAHRTQQSTQEIEQMVSGIQQGTDKAVAAMQSSNGRARDTLEVARAAGKALDEIAVAIGQISERNLVIASASEEQAQVAREVDRNLVNIRDLSIQTSAGANQTSASSQELSRLAVDLNTLVARFSV
ncbi:methyl-accepting chemotaxis protein [Pseudomonas sp. CC6-YY-74]|uniref:methyl-accepting chemotaxis protein n=1 Tax=Pseudomonas sp. CC6-YY-74 TaxID=1930532 RepID=UPI0009A2340B|nr:methyl-accepting chemotaxis protein [Pseudomonas sp. CC6-YY-74]